MLTMYTFLRQQLANPIFPTVLLIDIALVLSCLNNESGFGTAHYICVINAEKTRHTRLWTWGDAFHRIRGSEDDKLGHGAVAGTSGIVQCSTFRPFYTVMPSLPTTQSHKLYGQTVFSMLIM